MNKFIFLSFIFLFNSLLASEHVFLLHGLARTSSSMSSLEGFLKKEGFSVSNLDYPSRKHEIQSLSSIVRNQIEKLSIRHKTLHVVTHSMGGIIIRYIQKTAPIENLGRVVMLSPPNNGSEVVDKLGDLWLFKKMHGPAGNQLSTASDSFVNSIGPANFDLGVITGDRSINWILSQWIPGKDDGKVSVESAKIEGMKGFQVVHATHPFIMKKKQVHLMVLAYLKNGQFVNHKKK